MPTQIPAKTCARSAQPLDASLDRTVSRERSWRAEAKDILMLSLLAAAMIYIVAFVIVWAHT